MKGHPATRDDQCPRHNYHVNGKKPCVGSQSCKVGRKFPMGRFSKEKNKEIFNVFGPKPSSYDTLRKRMYSVVDEAFLASESIDAGYELSLKQITQMLKESSKHDTDTSMENNVIESSDDESSGPSIFGTHTDAGLNNLAEQISTNEALGKKYSRQRLMRISAKYQFDVMYTIEKDLALQLRKVTEELETVQLEMHSHNDKEYTADLKKFAQLMTKKKQRYAALLKSIQKEVEEAKSDEEKINDWIVESEKSITESNFVKAFFFAKHNK
jgi:hypothetical protein